MTISDEAVEAGARAVYAHLRPECPKPWDELKPIWRANYRKEARAVLEAAAPTGDARIVMTEAQFHNAIRAAQEYGWDEAYGHGVMDERTSAAYGTDYGPNRTNPYRSQA